MVEIAAPAQTKSGQVGIGVAAFNLGQRPHSLGYENISVRTVAGATLRMIPYEELQHKARVRAGWATFFTVLGTGLNTYAASRQGYGYVGPYRFYSPVAGEMAMDRAASENAAMLNSVTAQLDATLAKLDAGVLRTTTIDPGTPFGGAVVFDLPKGVALKDLIVTVTFAGDAHSVPLDASAPELEQASSTDVRLSNRQSDVPQDNPAGVSTSTETQPPAEPPPPNPKCGMVPQRDGAIKLVPC